MFLYMQLFVKMDVKMEDDACSQTDVLVFMDSPASSANSVSVI